MLDPTKETKILCEGAGLGVAGFVIVQKVLNNVLRERQQRRKELMDGETGY